MRSAPWLAIAVAALGLGVGHSATGSGSDDPFAALRRPLHVPRIAAGARCPVSKAHTVSPAFGPGLGPGPVYPIGFDARGTLSFAYPPPPGSQFAGSGWGGQKVLWVGRRTYRGPILIRGRQLDGSNEVRFDLGGGAPLPELAFRAGESRGTSRGAAGWREFPSHTRLRAPGCYGYQIDGTSFSRVVVFRATLPTPPAPLGGARCQPPSPLGTFGTRLPESRGTTTQGSLWALFFPPTRTTWGPGPAIFHGALGKDFKIVVRISGAGDLRISTESVDGQTLTPDWGPTAHSGSTWTRPGNEWGIGFTFPTAGCWRLHVARAGAAGDVWIVLR